MAATAIAGLHGARVARTLRDGGIVSIEVDGHEHALSAGDLLFSMKPLEGYQVEREGSHAVALELEIDDELRTEGWAREIVHAIQGVRRSDGLDISDRIILTLVGDAGLMAAARTHQEYIAGEVLAVEVRYEPLSDVEPTLVDGLALRVAVTPV
jgi:isoleucyl-tRNA synthetase